MLSQDRIRELFDYDSETGIVTRKKTITYNAKQGKIVGCVSKNRLVVRVDGKMYLLHRLIWLHVYGRLPTFIDHINRNPLDNRLCNLREVTLKQNSENKAKQKNNKSGLKGVHWDTARKKWFACIQTNNKTIALGRYESKEEAYHAYRDAASKYHTHNPESN